MSADWDRLVKRGGESCTVCGSGFGQGAEIVTFLDLTDQGFERFDRCAACAETEGASHFSIWRRRLATRESASARKLDLAYLTDLFKRLDGHEDARARRVAWIVALLLLRRRVLEEVSRERRGGHEVLTLRLKKEEREFEVVDPGLDADAMRAIEDDLARIFNLETPAVR